MELGQAVRVAIHTFPGITTFHLAAPLLVFGEVVRQYSDAGWSVDVWSSDSGPVPTCDGPTLGDLAGPEVTDEADLIVFPSWPLDLPDPGTDLVDRVVSAHRRGARIAGFCLGAFPVAATGLLDGRRATTHWAAAGRFATEFPDVDLEADALYLDHGDVLTSAGTASSLDASLHLVRAALGSDAARTIARHLVVAPHRDGDQAQYIDRPILDADATPLGETITWALAHLDDSLDVETLAAHASMSPRNFSRRFREATGLSPARWVLARRLDEARHLLEATSWPVTRVAKACGFASAVTFRQNFVARYATTPTSYRSRFTTAED